MDWHRLASALAAPAGPPGVIAGMPASGFAPARQARHASVVTVKPGGAGTPLSLANSRIVDVARDPPAGTAIRS